MDLSTLADLPDVFTAENVCNAIRSLKVNNSTGGSFITAEVLKGLVDSYMPQAIATMFNYFAKQGLPPAWNVLALTSLHKNGN